MNSEASKATPEDRLYGLLDSVIASLETRVSKAGTDEENPPLSAAEVAAITALLKNNGVTSSGAKSRTGHGLRRALDKKLPDFDKEEELNVGGGR